MHTYIYTHTIKKNPKLCKSLLTIPINTTHNSHQLTGSCNAPLYLHLRHPLTQGRTSQGTNAPQDRAADALRGAAVIQRRCSDTAATFVLHSLSAEGEAVRFKRGAIKFSDMQASLQSGCQHMHHVQPPFMDEWKLSPSCEEQQQWNNSVKSHHCFILHAVLHAKHHPNQTVNLQRQ